MTDQSLPAVVHREVDQSARRMLWLGVGAALVLSLAALVQTFRQPEPPVVVSVSMKALVEDHMMATVGQPISQHEAELRTREFSAALDEAIRELTAEGPVLVLASEAVVGSGVPDFTYDIKARTRVLSRELAARRGATLPASGDTSAIDGALGELEAETEALAMELDPFRHVGGRDTP